MLLTRSYNTKTHFYEYLSLENDDDKYSGYAREISSYFRPLFMLKHQNKEVCRLEDDNLLRPWLGLLSLIIPQLRAKYTLKMEGSKENTVLSDNGTFYSIKIDEDLYAIKGHSQCVVTIWKNGFQIGLIKRSTGRLGKGFETIEVLYDKQISKQLITLFSIFGWQIFVGRINGNHTLTTISLGDQTFDINWQPSD